MKTDEEFGFRSKESSALQSYCNPCRLAAARERNLRNVYGITPAQYDALLEMQGGACAICGGQPYEGRSFAVDHDHRCCPGQKSCGKCLRGLLCQECNMALGKVRDSKQLLLNAIRYLDSGHLDLYLLLGEER